MYVTDSNSEPTYQGLPLGQWIQTNTFVNPGHLDLTNLLTLKQVSSADDYGAVHFELPVRYDALKTNDWILGIVGLGQLDRDGSFVECNLEGVDRGTNGDCVLWWNITGDSPGAHPLRAELIYNNGSDAIQIVGPAVPFYSSNAVQFSENDSAFDDHGAYLNAQLAEMNAHYVIKLYDPATTPPALMQTISNSTTNGLIRENWNLKYADGQTRFTGDKFEADFNVTFPNSTTDYMSFRHVLTRLDNQP